jgi:serpin B
VFGLRPKKSPPAEPRLFKNDFAFALHGRLARSPGNRFFSPLSIRAALGMACAGARGETADQMSQVLGFDAGDETAHAAVAALIDRLNESGIDEFELSVANSLWMQKGTKLQADFTSLVTRCYAGAIQSVDFREDPASACVLINRWVEEKTRKRIRDLIQRDALSVETSLVLANAVFFKGLWEQPFDEISTRREPFHLEGAEVQAPLMHQAGVARYVEGDGYQALDLGYRDGDLSMLVILPNREVGIPGLVDRFTATEFERCVAQLSRTVVEMFLPRFRITWSGDLGLVLEGLGMTLPFDSTRADFAGINGCRPPHPDSQFLSAVLHKAFVEVNEAGTEAAAATAVVAPARALFGQPREIAVFRADHPFLYFIRDRKSGAILFTGHLADPTQEAA